MRLVDHLEPGLVIHAMRAKDKPEALAELVARAASRRPEIAPEIALRVLQDRESLGSTGIGEGVAIPHGKLDDLTGVVMVVGRSETGVDFGALDFKPCRIFFCVIAPTNTAGLHLRILAQVSRLLKDETFKSRFLDAEDEAELWDLLSRA